MSFPIHRRRVIKANQRQNGKKLVWYVRVPRDLLGSNSVRTRQFTHKKDADKYAEQLRQARQSGSSAFFKLPLAEQSEILRALNDFGAPFILEALRMHRERKPLSDKSVSVLANECMLAKEQKGIRETSRRGLQCSLDSFAAFTNKAIDNVTSADVDAWLASHSNWSPKTKLGRIRDVSSMFNFGVKRGFITANPCLGVERPKVPFKDVEVLPVAALKTLLETCQKHDPKLLGYICPILFGGLRHMECRRATKADFKNGMIVLSGEQLKLNERRVIKQSDQLKAWLACGAEIGGVNIRWRLRAVCKFAKVKMPKNCLRHSFCSYSLAAGMGFEDVARAANNSPAILKKHYLAVATDKDGKAFAELMPVKSRSESPA